MKLLIVLAIILRVSLAAPPTVDAPSYLYRKTPQNEKAINSGLRACNDQCDSTLRHQSLVDEAAVVARAACTRRCLSPTCYDNIYGKDPLEEGEVDVRHSSFKGCLLLQVRQQRMQANHDLHS